MIHPLFRLIASEPQMLADHVEAYTDLVSEELAAAMAHWKHQAMAAALIWVCVLVTAVLSGVSLMLWAVTPPENIHSAWALFIAPLTPALLAAWAYLSTQSANKETHGFAAIKAQFSADAAMLRSVDQS